MTLVRAGAVVRGAGHAGWPLLPPPATTEPRPRIKAASPLPPLPCPEDDDLVALAVALNGPGSAVYFDRRPDRAA